MRLGGPVWGELTDPVEWAEAHRLLGYSAAYCPNLVVESVDLVNSFRLAAMGADLVIAEVGAWSNPISTDDALRKEAIELCQRRLALADEIGARCCVNIAGSRGSVWDGPDATHYQPYVFDLIVETVREIIDAVRPTNTFYALETMPWVPPDSVDSYIKLIEAINRPAFAVHLDPVNLVHSPYVAYHTADLLKDCFDRMGPWIKSCHAKDILLRPNLTVHLDEVCPGEGMLDYSVFIRCIENLNPEIPLMLEHLPDSDAYRKGAEHIRAVARQEGVSIR